MSEVKFACPICGQHITADSASTGSQLECPTCYRKIVVPQAPASSDPKFIISAAEANKPRAPQASLPKLEPVSSEPVRRAVPLALIVVLILLCLAGAATVAFRGKIFGGKNSKELAGASSAETNEETAASEAPVAKISPISNSVPWNVELTEAVFPESQAAGKLRGEFVACNRNTLTGGALAFRQATKGLPDLSVTIYFFAKQAEEMAGKTINIATNDTRAPRVTIRWKEGKDTRSQNFTNGYALKLEMGDIANNRVPGKVYLSLPDEAQSRVAGIFNAEIRKPTPPKPRVPKAK